MMYGIMVVAFIGMVIGLQKEKGGAAWGRPVAIVCILIALAAAGVTMFGGGAGGGAGAANINLRYQAIKGEVLGRELSGQFAGKRAVILLPPEMPTMGEPGEPIYKSVLEGLKKGMGNVTIVAEIEPKMPADVKARMEQQMAAGGMEDMGMMEGQMWFNVASLNQELQPHKGNFDLLICLTGLPGLEGAQGMMAPGVRMEPYTNLDVWKDGDVKIALAEGSINRLGRAINDGKIVAAVTYKQQIDADAWEKQPPSDLQEAFNMRFVLITPQNVREHMAYFTTR